MPNNDDDSDIDYDALWNGMMTSADPLVARMMIAAMGVTLIVLAAIVLTHHG